MFSIAHNVFREVKNRKRGLDTMLADVGTLQNVQLSVKRKFIDIYRLDRFVEMVFSRRALFQFYGAAC